MNPSAETIGPQTESRFAVTQKPAKIGGPG